MMKLVPKESIEIIKNSEYLYVPIRSIKSILIISDIINNLLNKYTVTFQTVGSKYLYMRTDLIGNKKLIVEYCDSLIDSTIEFDRCQDLFISIINKDIDFLSNLEYILIKLRLDDSKEILNYLLDNNIGIDITISHNITVCIFNNAKKICLYCNQFLEKYYEYDNADNFLELFKRRG